MTPQPNDRQQQLPGSGTKPSASDPLKNFPADAAQTVASGAVIDPEAMDEVDQAIFESFPASDPPSYTGGSATPSIPRERK